MKSARISSSFKDHFSGHAVSYADARPGYSDSLFNFLAEQCLERASAWDCATGNGQAAYSLTTHFDRVVATDASQQQLLAARGHERIEYRVAPAEASGLRSGSIDLVTVAQALHWFDIETFFGEAERVLVPGGVLAFWCYGACNVASEIDGLLREIYLSVDDYWAPEREIVESEYRDIKLPLPQIECPPFAMTANWTVEQLLAYFRTWSASQAYMRETGRDAMAAYSKKLENLWGSNVRTVTWPLAIKVMRKPLE